MNIHAVPKCHSDIGGVTPAPRGRRVFLDTETLGFHGLPFLVQFKTKDEPNVRILHILETPPSEVVELLRTMFSGGEILVGHNLMFDLLMLSKLATIAEMVPDWSFESVWQAERLWRG